MLLASMLLLRVPRDRPVVYLTILAHSTCSYKTSFLNLLERKTNSEMVAAVISGTVRPVKMNVTFSARPRLGMKTRIVSPSSQIRQNNFVRTIRASAEGVSAGTAAGG
jgi:hypothetical protein